MTEEAQAADRIGEVTRLGVDPACPNCAARADGPFCSQCGTQLATSPPGQETTEVSQYSSDGRCTDCDKVVESGARALHPRYCLARPGAALPQNHLARTAVVDPPPTQDQAVLASGASVVDGSPAEAARDSTALAPPTPGVAALASPGWYADPEAPGQRWWDGQHWGARAPGAPAPVGQTRVLPPSEKSSGVAILLTFLWPGAGHIYLGLNNKGMPYVIANAVGLVCGLTGILIFVTAIIWLVTFLMLVGAVTKDTELVNNALRQGIRVAG